jgi:hypothetical protein
MRCCHSVATDRLRGMKASVPAAVAFDHGMNLAPVQVEHAHGDGARRPVVRQMIGKKRKL